MTPLPSPEHRALHWLHVQRLTLRCLGAWFGSTFLVIYFARELATLTIWGWPVSFYMAAQGLVIIYLAIIGYYAIAMRAFDKILSRSIAP